MLIVSDDFSGLKEAIAALFPRSIHQLCFIHLQRNVRRNMGKEDARAFNDELSLIRKDKSFDAVVSRFEALAKQYQGKYKAFIAKLLLKKELYFDFLKFPLGIRKHIYTTNLVENFNSRLEVKRINTGGHFQSLKTVDIAVYIIVNNLSRGGWKKVMPSFKDVEYELASAV
jgi:transposase-like protein